MNDDVQLCFIETFITHAPMDNTNFSLDFQNETLIHVCFQYFVITHKSNQEMSLFESSNYEFITSRMRYSAFNRKSLTYDTDGNDIIIGICKIPSHFIFQSLLLSIMTEFM